MADKLIPYNKIVNNLLATDTKTVLSGPMGATLQDQITQLNSDLTGSYTFITNNCATLTAGSLIKTGRVCQIYLTLEIIKSHLGYVNILKLPQGYIPRANGFFDNDRATVQLSGSGISINALTEGTCSIYACYLSK